MTMRETNLRRWRKPSVRTVVSRREPTLGEEFVEGYQSHPGRRMTEEEFLAWIGEKTRAEWVNGDVIIMSPVNLEHDAIQGWLYRLFCEFVEARHLGRVCGSEVSIRLRSGRVRRLADLFFVGAARTALFKKTYFDGAPDVVVEVVSPDSTSRDYREKFDDYEASGVGEYWVINSLAQRANAYELEKGKYRELEEKKGIIRSQALKGLFIKPAWLWYPPFPRLATVLREMGVQ
jgi:Uma2 family endonuclease